MSSVFLVSFFAGLLLAVRVMFFGAERRRYTAGTLPLRRSEPAFVAFLVMFGIVGYLLTRSGLMMTASRVGVSVAAGVVFAAIVTRLAIATARIQPEHDPDDARYLLQGRVGVVTMPIPAGGEGMIRYGDAGAETAVRACEVSGGAVPEGEEICIERVEDGVAHVERWAAVEARL